MQIKKAKDRIIETATQLFHQKGYNSTGINEVIAEAQVAKSTLYQHFKSKDALCVAFLEHRHEQWFDRLQKMVNEQPSTKAKLLGLFDFVMLMNTQENFRGCSFLNIISEVSNEQQAIIEVVRSHKTDLQNYITELAGKAWNAQAMHLYFLFESAIIESQLYRSQTPVLEIKQIVEQLLNKG